MSSHNLTDSSHSRKNERSTSTSLSRFQFSLRTLFALMLGIAVWLGYCSYLQRQQVAVTQVISELSQRGISCEREMGKCIWCMPIVSERARITGIRVSDYSEGCLALLSELDLSDVHSMSIEGEFANFSSRDVFVVKRMKGLESISLSCMHIDRDAVAALSELPRLKSLSINVDLFTDETARSFLPRNHIQILDLTGTRITSRVSSTLATFGELKELYVRGTGFTQSGAEELERLNPTVELIQLDNEIREASVRDLENSLRNLATSKASNLIVSSRCLVDDDFDSPGGIASIRELDLSATFVTGRVLEHLSHPERVVRLLLARTAITNESCEVISKCVNLKSLTVSQTALTGDGLAAIGPLSQLRDMDVSGTLVGDELGQYLRMWPNLEMLDMSSCHVSDTILEAIAKTEIKTLVASDTAITAKGVAALRATNPGVEVILSVE